MEKHNLKNENEQRKRCVNERITSYRQKKKKISEKKNRFLISVNVLGSAGPIRFLVNEDDSVAGVMDTALKSYAREGRLPVLGIDVNSFLLYCANAGSDALNPWERIGSCGGRNFLLCKKQFHPHITEDVMRRRTNEGVDTWGRSQTKGNKNMSFTKKKSNQRPTCLVNRVENGVPKIIIHKSLMEHPIPNASTQLMGFSRTSFNG